MNCWPWPDADDAKRRRWRESVAIVLIYSLVVFALGMATATTLALIYLAPALQSAGCCG
jgi:hypothetical protein